jgi:hypothetical protein
MAAQRLSILPAVITAYRDLWRALLAMRALFVIALLIVLAIKVAEGFVPLRLWNGPVPGLFLGFIVGAVQIFFLTPFMIAVYRFIILDEVAAAYVLDPGRPEFIPLFGWNLVLSTITPLAFLLLEILRAIGVSVIPAIVLSIIALVAMIIASMRLIILFPAIAVDAPGANASHALADTKGHTFRIFMIFLLALLPLVALVFIVTLMLGSGVRNAGTPAAFVQLAVGTLMQTTITALYVAVAARVFQALGDRVLRRA